MQKRAIPLAQRTGPRRIKTGKYFKLSGGYIVGAILTVVSKVAVMLIMITIGYIMTKRGMLTNKGVAEITTLLLKIVTPCLIVNAFLSSRGSLAPKDMLYAALIPAIATAISFLLSLFAYRKEEAGHRAVLRFGVIFGNVGFMGVPLVQGIVGDAAVVYAAFGIVVFNLVCWTYGYKMMNSEAKMSLKTILLNPGIVGIAIGLPLYFTSFKIPEIIAEPLSGFAALNTPLAMLVIGSYIAKVDLRSFVSDKRVYHMSALRLLIAPGIFFLVMLLLRPTHDLFLCGVIQASTPVAANAVLFAAAYGKDSELASKSVAVSTVISVITIPIFTVMAQAAISYLY